MRFLRILIVCLLGLYLGIYNGHLALWQQSNTMPLQVFPYRAELYPQADQAALNRKIPINSTKDLSKLLEDYFS